MKMEDIEKNIKSFFSFCKKFNSTAYSLLLNDGTWICIQENQYYYRLIKFPILLLDIQPHFRLVTNLDVKNLDWLDLDLDELEYWDFTRYLVIKEELDKSKFSLKKHKWLKGCDYSIHKAILYGKYTIAVKFECKKNQFKGVLVKKVQV